MFPAYSVKARNSSFNTRNSRVETRLNITLSAESISVSFSPNLLYLSSKYVVYDDLE